MSFLRTQQRIASLGIERWVIKCIAMNCIQESDAQQFNLLDDHAASVDIRYADFNTRGWRAERVCERRCYLRQ